MYFHKTNGTVDYLESLKEKYPNAHLQANPNTGILYYEDNEAKSAFETEQSYEIVDSKGDLSEDHPTYTVHIPAYGIGKSTIISHLSDFRSELDNVKGVKSYRIARKLDQDSYLVIVTFTSIDAYHDFKQTDTFKNYLTQDVLKKFQNEESMFQDFATSQLYFTVKEVEQDEEDEF